MNTKDLIQRLILSAILAVGFLIAWGTVALYTGEVGIMASVTGEHAENLMFLADGTPRVVEYLGRGDRQCRDLEGHAVPPPEDELSWLAPVPLAASLPDRVSARDSSWGRRIHSFADGRALAVYWYFVSDGRLDGHAYFVGYDSRSNDCIGYLGTAGFRKQPLPASELFPFAEATSGIDSRVLSTQGHRYSAEHPRDRTAGRAPPGSLSAWDVYVLSRDGKLYHADLQERTVGMVLDEPGLRSAAVFGDIHEPGKGTPQRLAVRTKKAVLVLDERGGVLRRYPVPEAMAGRELYFAQTNAGEAVMYTKQPQGLLETEEEYRICLLQPDGRSRQASVVLPALSEIELLHVAGGVIVPCPVLADALLGILRTRNLLEKGQTATYLEAVNWTVQEFWPALMIIHLLAAGLAVLCYRRQVRFGANRAERVVWPLFVLALGLPGWIGYRFGRSWPVLESCPACGTSVPRDRTRCARCEEEFALPAMQGTEVFA
jgi:hypothetical protein